MVVMLVLLVVVVIVVVVAMVAGFFARLVRLAAEVDPHAVAVPMISTASTDARVFAQLGISCYGWLPAPGSARERVRLHQADENLPVSALFAGADAYHDLLRSHP